MPGFVADRDRAIELMGQALCMLLPSRREGYGLVVIEAAARGTPSVVVAAPTTRPSSWSRMASTASIAASASPEDLAAAILACQRGRARVCALDRRLVHGQRARLSLDGSLEDGGAPLPRMRQPS